MKKYINIIMSGFISWLIPFVISIPIMSIAIGYVSCNKMEAL